MKKLSILLSGLLVLLLLISGLAVVQAAPKVTITLWHCHGPWFNPIVTEVIKQYEATHPGVKVVSEYVPWDAAVQRILTAAAAGKLPDVMYANPQWVPPLIAKGVFREIDRSILSDDLDQNPPGFNEIFYDQQDRQMLVPMFGGGDMIYYRTDFAKEAGIDKFPTTWDGLIEWGKKTTKYDSSGRIIREGYRMRFPTPSGSDMHWVRMQFRQLLLAQGADITDKSGKRATFGGPEGLKALQFMHDLIWKYKISLPLSKQAVPPAGSQPLLQNTCAADFCGPWLPTVILPALQQDPSFKDKWNCSYLTPKPIGGRDVCVVGGDGWGVSRTCKYPKEAFEFVKVLVSKDTQIKFFLSGGHPVSRNDAMLSDTVRKFVAEKMTSAVNLLDLWQNDKIRRVSKPEMVHPNNREIDKALVDRFVPALEDPHADLKAVLKAAVEDVNRIISQ
ncbi:MAG: extracellular solute-binding protein [Firmicutes bacterium]|nr:extracellular solute-binding protein [Bacillota bacterium]